MKNISSDIANFLIQNEQLINRNNFQQVYKNFDILRLKAGIRYIASYLTEIFINSGIDFLIHMDRIPDSCFQDLDIKSISIPSSIKIIQDKAFEGCKHLSNVQLADSIEIIYAMAFSDCPQLRTITLPDSITLIGSFAFSDCPQLKTITLPDSITSLESFAFYNCVNLNQVTIGKNLHKLPISCFAMCDSLSHIIIPDSITSIESGSFSGSGVEELKLPHSLEILSDIVYGCQRLRSIYIPKSCTRIDAHQFRSCPKLKDIYFEGSEEEWQSKIDYNIRKSIKIHFNVKY